LAIDPLEEIEEVGVPSRVELRRDVVEEEDRRLAVDVAEERHLGGLPGGDERAELALRRVPARLVAAEEERHGVDMRSHAGLAAGDVAAAPGLQRDGQAAAKLLLVGRLEGQAGVVAERRFATWTGLRDRLEGGGEARSELRQRAQPGGEDARAGVGELRV